MNFYKVAIYSVAAVVSVGIVASFFIDGTRSSFKAPYSSAALGDGITDVEIQFINNKMFLTVNLNQPLTCSQVINDLGITSIVIKEKTYSPKCNIISPILITITYEQVIDV